MNEADELPEGWTMSERGPVSPNGRVYDVIPQAYEVADLGIFDAILDALLAESALSTEPSVG